MEEDPKAQTRKKTLLAQLDRSVTLLKMATPPPGPLRDTFEHQVAAIKKGLGELEQEQGYEYPRRFWFTELWYEKRELFKEMVGETFFVASILVLLEGIHRLIAMTSLEPYQVVLLSKAHFYLTFASLGILSLGFIITLAKSLRGKTK